MYILLTGHLAYNSDGILGTKVPAIIDSHVVRETNEGKLIDASNLSLKQMNTVEKVINKWLDTKDEFGCLGDIYENQEDAEEEFRIWCEEE